MANDPLVKGLITGSPRGEIVAITFLSYGKVHEYKDLCNYHIEARAGTRLKRLTMFLVVVTPERLFMKHLG